MIFEFVRLAAIQTNRNAPASVASKRLAVGGFTVLANGVTLRSDANRYGLISNRVYPYTVIRMMLEHP